MRNSTCTGIRWLIVVATGRSGSTTVMDMLNALPTVSVRGEMSGTVGLSIDMLDAADAGREVKDGPLRHFQASEQALECILERWFATLCTPSWQEKRGEYVGFKELFWEMSRRSVSTHSFERLALLMERVFPGAKFVLSTREDTAAQSKSGFWASQGVVKEQRLPRNVTGYQTKGLLDVSTALLRQWGHRLGPDRSYWLPLPRNGFTIQQFNDLAQWLGVPCRFLSIAHANKDNTYRANHTDTTVSCGRLTAVFQAGLAAVRGAVARERIGWG
jgi:hypothetical protein